MKVVLAGGSGALGRRIAADLTARGDEVVVLTRSVRPERPYRQVHWDGETVGAWAAELAGAAVINLAGELVDRRPTAANIDLLTRSRVQPTRALTRAAASLDDPPTAWVQASTLAIYGDGGDAVLDENAAAADGPPQMAGVARAWEQATAEQPTERQVILRTGVVFDRDTPALDRLVGLARWGLGGRISSGRQWVSWLHIADLLAIVRRSLDDPTMTGVFHATSPHPVRNTELMAALRQVLRRPPAPPTPAPLVRLGALLLRTDPALALTGRRCVSGPAARLELHLHLSAPGPGPAELARQPAVAAAAASRYLLRPPLRGGSVAAAAFNPSVSWPWPFRCSDHGTRRMLTSKNRKIVISVVGGILLLCLVGLIGGGLFRTGEEPSKRPSSAPAEAGMIPTPDPTTRNSYIAALEAIDPDIVHGRTEKAVNRGRDLCTTIKYHSNDHERLVNETRKRFTSHRHPRGFGKQKSEQILAAVRRYICPTF